MKTWLLFQLFGRSYYDTRPLHATLERVVDFDTEGRDAVAQVCQAFSIARAQVSYQRLR